jgi:hypothetical protein
LYIKASSPVRATVSRVALAPTRLLADAEDGMVRFAKGGLTENRIYQSELSAANGQAPAVRCFAWIS